MMFSLLLLIKNLVFDTFTFRLFLTNFRFQAYSLFLTSSRDSVAIAKSSVFETPRGNHFESHKEMPPKQSKFTKT